MEEIQLPNLNCGLCGFKSCDEMKIKLKKNPELIERCVILSSAKIKKEKHIAPCFSCQNSLTEKITWKDSLQREYDFVLDHFPEDPGPREIIHLHNPSIIEKLDIKIGDILIGRPLGMSCGCPITHCGEAIKVEKEFGVITWCVTGPLNPRQKKYKNLGYYSAEGYEGIVKESQKELKIGMRYYFLPRRCMLQWRHSGLLNFLNKSSNEYQIRVEGLLIG